MEEKRKYVRVETPLIIQYKTVEEPYTKNHVTARDISEGGFSFIGYEWFPNGTMLDIEIQTPFDTVPIFAKGKIVWIKQIGKEDVRMFEAGFNFMDVDIHEKKRLNTYVNNAIKERIFQPSL